MIKKIIKIYKNFLLFNTSLWFKYKRFLDKQLNYCYHILEKHNTTVVKDIK